MTAAYDDLRAEVAAAEQEFNALQADDTISHQQLAAAQASLTALQAKYDALAADEAADEATIAADKQKMTDLQAAFDAYKASHPDTNPPPPPPPPPPTSRFPGDPGAGKMYVGESRGPEAANAGAEGQVGVGGDPSDREKYWGAKVGLFRSYFLWGQWDAAFARIQRDLGAGRLPWLSMHTGSNGWAAMGAGTYDADQKTFFARVAALGKPVWWTWDHEPVDNPEQGTPAQFCAMNRHTMGLIPKNVALVPIVQTYPFDPTQMSPGATPASFGPWYEKGSYTFVGIDTYNHRWYVPFGTYGAPGGQDRSATTILSVCDKVRKDLGDSSVAIGIAETGIRTDPANPGKAAKGLTDLVAQAPAKGVVAISYFDSAQNSPQGPWALDSTYDKTDGKERINAYGPLVKAGARLPA